MKPERTKDIAVISALALTGYLAPVLVSALTNATELVLKGALELSVLTVCALWAGGYGLLRLGGPARGPLRGALVLVSAVCVANSSLFLWDFGLFDGRPIVLGDHLPKVLAELSFLGVAIVLFIRFRLAIDERIIGISIALTLVAFAPLAEQARALPRAVRAYATQSPLSFDFGDEDLLSFSRGQNVLVFVIDAFETTHFLQSLANNPRLADAFTGFTLFRNNAGIAPNTTYSVPAMMSGVPFTGDRASDEYLAAALLGPTSLPVVLRKHRYDVRMFTHNSIPYEPGVAAWDNVEKAGGRAAAIAGWLSLTRLGSYRVAPTPLKLLLRDEAGFGRLQARVIRATGAAKAPLAEPFDDAGLLLRLARNAKPALSRPVLRWFHLQGIHEPLTLLSSAERSRLSLSHAQAWQLQADRFLEKFADMLQAVRERGLYQSATIVVIGDHGLDDRRMPAMLIKPAEATAALVTSDAPTANTDLPATVLALVGIHSSQTGADAFSLDPNIPRTRLFFEFYSVDQVTGRPKAVVTQVLTSQQNTAAHWRSEAPRYPAFLGRERTTDFVGFTGNTRIDPRTVRGIYSRAVGGIHWSEWLEVDVALPEGTPLLAEFLYYRYGSGPERVAISVDGAQRGEVKTSSFASLRLLLPAKSALAGRHPHATVRFSFKPSPAANETLLFVDLVTTRLGGKDSPALQPVATGVNCNLNAIWAAGGEFWGTKPRLLALVNTALFDVIVDEVSQAYSFVMPAGALAKPIAYRLLDASTGVLGPELRPIATCPGG